MGDHDDEDVGGDEDMMDESDVGILPQAFRQLIERADGADELDSSMVISEEERRWALALQQAVRDHLDEFSQHPLISDMEFAQHAIVARGNTQEALQHIIGQHNFFMEYGIDHTSEQALYYLREFMRQQPGYLLHLDNTPATQESLLVIDAAALSPTAALQISRENGADYNWRINAVGYYYIHYVVQPSLSSMRQGLFAIVECQGLEWHNFNMEYDRRLHAEMFGSLPLRYKATLAYNTSVVANLVFNLVRPIMPRSMRESLHLGCQVMDADGSTSSTRLSELYVQPSLEAAQERILQQASTLVATRFYNETIFRL